MKILSTPAFSNKNSNPYNYLLSENLIMNGCDVVEDWTIKNIFTCDVWHVHWPESFLTSRTYAGLFGRFIFFLTRVLVIKSFGKKIIWTVHNEQPHENRSKYLSYLFYNFFPKVVDGFIFLSESARRGDTPWVRKIPKEKTIVVFHGHYKSVIKKKISRESAREILGLNEEFIFLYFGLIREYKNVPKLINVYKELAESDTRLIIIGSVDKNTSLSNEIVDLISGVENIDYINEFASNEKLSQYLFASNAVVLPYKQVTNSGSIMFALSHGRVVLAPRNPSFKEISEIVGEHNLILYEDELSKDHLLNLKSNLNLYNDFEIDLSQFDWDALAKQTKHFIKKVLIKG